MLDRVFLEAFLISVNEMLHLAVLYIPPNLLFLTKAYLINSHTNITLRFLQAGTNTM